VNDEKLIIDDFFAQLRELKRELDKESADRR